jgi:hypothetical protein
MATAKQIAAARRNIKKAQKAWKSMSAKQHAKAQPGGKGRAKAQPGGKGRAKPGSTGEGEYYHIEVRPKSLFVTFRTHDVGKKGGIQRVGGKRSSGSWDDQKWLISKEYAHIESGKLVPDTEDARKVLNALGSKPVRVSGDRFKAKPRPNVPEKDKPTAAQRKARKSNIKKAQATRRS